jgi:hypothetical protein
MAEHVALTNCFFCGKPDKILLATRYDHKGDPVHDLVDYQGKVVDMDPCKECRELMNQGVILLAIDESKSEKDWNKPPQDHNHLPPEKRPVWMPNPYRTGGFFVLRDEAVRRIFRPEAIADYALRHRWMFIEHSAAEKIGLLENAPKTEV